MPIVRDESGRSVWQRLPLLDTAHPREFFKGNPEGYAARRQRAEYKVFDTIRHLRGAAAERGLCHEFPIDAHDDRSPMHQLADFVHFRDDRRAKKVREQRYREATVGLGPYEARLRSPQRLSKRRSHLFGGGDIPRHYFGPNVSAGEISHFVQRMRWLLVVDAIETLDDHEQLYYFDGAWVIPVSAMDEHRLGYSQSANRVKRDDRSWHGKPNRDRDRVLVSP